MKGACELTLADGTVVDYDKVFDRKEKAMYYAIADLKSSLAHKHIALQTIQNEIKKEEQLLKILKTRKKVEDFINFFRVTFYIMNVTLFLCYEDKDLQHQKPKRQTDRRTAVRMPEATFTGDIQEIRSYDYRGGQTGNIDKEDTGSAMTSVTHVISIYWYL